MNNTAAIQQEDVSDTHVNQTGKSGCSIMALLDEISRVRVGMEHLHSIISANPEIEIQELSVFSGLLVEKFEQVDLDMLKKFRTITPS